MAVIAGEQEPLENRVAESNERGQALILTALSMSILMGISALSIDASFMYDKRNRLHAAADAAAKTAALEVRRKTSISVANLKNFADQQVTAHGFTPGACGTSTLGTSSVCVAHPPSSGAFAGNANYVQVTVTERTATFFGGVFGWNSLTPGATAVAGVSNPLGCLVTKQGLSVGNTTMTLNGCGVSVGGNLAGTNPNAEITGTPLPEVGVTGTCTGTCGHMGMLTTGAASPGDPLAGLLAPTNPGGCVAGTAATLSPGCYTSISSSVTNLNAGQYYVTGTVNIGNLTGPDVFIYLTGSGKLAAGNNKALTLTSPTSGTYAGIAIFQDPSDTLPFAPGNHFDISVSGAIYMPGSDLDFGNHVALANTGCTLILVKSLILANGSGGVVSNNSCAGTYGGAGYLSVSMAE